MKNPFEIIEARLNNIEILLLAIKQKPEEQNEHSEQGHKFLSVKQVARFLNLSVPTIYSKCSRAELPYMKRGKRLYFSLTEINDYLKAGRVKTNSELEKDADNYLYSKD